VFENALQLELSYREYLEKLASLANSEGDVLTTLKVAGLLDAQVESCSEYEVIVNKARSYSAMQGLLYHLDHELKKKAKK
jgi:ferritin